MANFFAAKPGMSKDEAAKSSDAGEISSITIPATGVAVFGIWGGDGSGQWVVPKLYRAGNFVPSVWKVVLEDPDNWIRVIEMSGLQPGDEIFGMTADGSRRFTQGLWVEGKKHGPVVIFVNSMGKAEVKVKNVKKMVPDAGGVQFSAQRAAQEVFGGRASVYTTRWTKDDNVTFTFDAWLNSGIKTKAKKIFWDDVRDASTIVYMGHCGGWDGPILAHQETAAGYNTVYGPDYNSSQPWPVMPTFADRGKTFQNRGPNDPNPYDGSQVHRNTLTPNAVKFWQKIGQQNGRTNDVQIIIYGCDSGQSYAAAVSQVANCPVWGALYHCSPGIWPSDTKFNLENMMAGKVIAGKFKRFLS